jgi:hypothetical protein
VSGHMSPTGFMANGTISFFPAIVLDTVIYLRLLSRPQSAHDGLRLTLNDFK